jgi:hypothetical protein
MQAAFIASANTATRAFVRSKETIGGERVIVPTRPVSTFFFLFVHDVAKTFSLRGCIMPDP